MPATAKPHTSVPTLTPDSKTATILPRDSNQALGIGQFAVDFMSGKIGKPAQAVLDRTVMFHTDAVLCGVSAIAIAENQVLEYYEGSREFHEVGLPRDIKLVGVSPK